MKNGINRLLLLKRLLNNRLYSAGKKFKIFAFLFVFYDERDQVRDLKKIHKISP